MKRKIFLMLLILLICITSISTFVYSNNNDIEKASITEDNDNSISLLSAAAPTGCLDYVNSYGFAGWAWRPDIPNTPIYIHVYCNNITTGEIFGPYAYLADRERADLANAGIGNGYHGFEIDFNWNNLSAGVYDIVVYAIGDGYNPSLVNCPKNYTITNPTGSLDVVNDNVISGWAWRSSKPNRAINVTLILNNLSNGQEYRIDNLPANIFRQDLLDSNVGDGCHKFEYEIDWSNYASGNYSVSAYGIGYNNTKYKLTNSSKNYNNKGYAYLAGAYFFGDVNTTSIISKSKKALKEEGFLTWSDTNPSFNELNGTVNERKKLECNVVLLSTHSNNTIMTFPSTALTLGYTDEYWLGINKMKMVGVDSVNWSKTNLVILGGCNTAKEDGITESIASKIYEKGADAVIGFKDSILMSSLEDWCVNFFEMLKISPLKTSFNYANSQFYEDTRVTKSKLYCEGNIFIGSPADTNNLKKNTTLNNLDKQKKYYPNKDIMFYTQDDISNVSEFLKTKNKNFDISNYDIKINDSFYNDEVIKTIYLEYVIGDFYTNSGYIVILENNKIKEIIDNSVELNLNEEELEEIEQYRLSEEKLLEYKDKAKNEILSNNNILIDEEEQSIKLIYDIKENKKYISIIYKIKDKETFESNAYSLIDVKYEIK